MPTEERFIIFTPAEVLDAMKEFANRKDRPMPRGKLDGLSFEPDAEPALILDLSQPGSPIAQKIAFRYPEVAAALIMYCKERSIPLPKQHKKLIGRDGVPAFRILMETPV